MREAYYDRGATDEIVTGAYVNPRFNADFNVNKHIYLVYIIYIF